MKENIVEIVGMLHLAAQHPGRLNRHERIVAVNRHAEFQRNVCHARSYGAKADDAEGLPHQFRAGKGAFSLFHQQRDFRSLIRD